MTNIFGLNGNHQSILKNTKILVLDFKKWSDDGH